MAQEKSKEAKQTRFRNKTDIASAGKYKSILFEILGILYANSIKVSKLGDCGETPLLIWGDDEKKPKEGSLGWILWNERHYQISRKSLSKYMSILLHCFGNRNEWTKALGIQITEYAKGRYLLLPRFYSDEIDWIRRCLNVSPGKESLLAKPPKNYLGKPIDPAEYRTTILKKLMQYQVDLVEKEKDYLAEIAVVEELDKVYHEESRQTANEQHVIAKIGPMITAAHPFKSWIKKADGGPGAAIVRSDGDHFFSRFGDYFLPVKIVVSRGHYYVLALVIKGLKTIPVPCILAVKDIVYENVEPCELTELWEPSYETKESIANCILKEPGHETKESIANCLRGIVNDFNAEFDVREYLNWHDSLCTTDIVRVRMADFHIRGKHWSEETNEALLDLASRAHGEFEVVFDEKKGTWEVEKTLRLDVDFAIAFAIKYAGTLILSAKCELFETELRNKIRTAFDEYCRNGK